MLRNPVRDALAILSRELDLGPVPLESHGPSTQTVLGGWLVVRGERLADECTADLFASVNAQINRITVEESIMFNRPLGRTTRRIAELFYAVARIAH